MNDNSLETNDAWSERENVIFPQLFNNLPDNIITPQDASNIAIGGSELILSCAGVYEIPPSDEHPCWTYLTSGLTNPYFQDSPLEMSTEDFDAEPQFASGFGFELLIQLPEKANWPVNLLFNLMGYVLTGNIFETGHRLPCNGPIVSDNPNCQLTTLLFWLADNFPNRFEMSSGQFELLQIHALTDLEYQFCQNNSSLKMYEILKRVTNFPLIDISRTSVIQNSDKIKPRLP